MTLSARGPIIQYLKLTFNSSKCIVKIYQML